MPVHTIYGYNGSLPVATITGPRIVQNPTTSGGAIASYYGRVLPGQVVCSFSRDYPTEIALEVCLPAGFKSSSLTPFYIKLENATTGQQIFSDFLVSADGSNCGGGMNRAASFIRSISPGQYRVVTAGAAIAGDISVVVVASLTTKNVFYTSFEDYTLPQSVAGGKTGSKCWQGAFGVGMPFQLGEYELSFWSASTANGIWTYQHQNVQVTAGNAGTNLPIGSATAFLDEVRFYPIGSVLSTQTYVQGRGVGSAMDHNGIQQVTEYDDFGRLDVIKNNDLDIIQQNQYKIGLP